MTQQRNPTFCPTTSISKVTAWVLIALLLAVPALALSGALLGVSSPSFEVLAANPVIASLIWQRDLSWHEPWRHITSVWVHFSTPHLAANLLGTLGVIALGGAAGVSPRAAWAWLAAWPVTQLGLLIDPRLHGYGGLSGVLHAGVAVVAVSLLRGEQRLRWMGWLLLAGTAIKVLNEAPWRGVVHPADGLGIAVVPLAHGLGWAAGVLCAAVLLKADRA